MTVRGHPAELSALTWERARVVRWQGVRQWIHLLLDSLLPRTVCHELVRLRMPTHDGVLIRWSMCSEWLMLERNLDSICVWTTRATKRGVGQAVREPCRLICSGRSKSGVRR